MAGLPIVRFYWSVFLLVPLLLLAAIACGVSATATPAPTNTPVAVKPPTPVPAAAPPVVAVPPAPTPTSAIGQGAVGAIPVSTPTPTPAAPKPAAKPKVTLIKVARESSVHETNDPALSGRVDLTFLLPMYEGLIYFDQFTDLQPMLATGWSANDRFTVWTIKLRQGIPFHKGSGEMTAKDVVHTFGQERRKDHFDARGAIWRALIDRIETPAGPDGYEVVFHLTKPEPIMLDYIGTNYTSVIRNKKRWDAAGGALTDFQPNEAGIKVMQEDPIGTGPYKFLKRAEAQYIQYESPGYKHWRITPEFPELQIFFVPESSTRLAMLLTKEVHVAEVPRDLQRGAEAKGMKVFTGTTPAIRLVGFFGGNYLPSKPQYDPSSPVVNAKVREAMNRAINRAEVNKVFFGGRAELMMQTHSHPKFPGWEASWPDRFEKAYGYDPERAKKLLAEAGYPKGFTITHHSYPRPGLPEAQDIAELINGYWKAIGIDTKFEPIEDAKHTALRRDYKTVRTVWLHTGSFTEPTRAIFVYHYDPSRFHGFDDEWFEQKYKVLEVAPTPKERDALIRETGERCFQIYCTIPLFWVPFEFMVNPGVVSEWKTPGVFSLRDYEHVKVAR